MHSAPELLGDVILPGALEMRSQLADDFAEMRDQLAKQTARLQELRVKKAEEPGTPTPHVFVPNVTPTIQTSFMAPRIHTCTTWM